MGSHFKRNEQMGAAVAAMGGGAPPLYSSSTGKLPGPPVR